LVEAFVSVVFQLILIQGLPNFLLTCTNVMSTKALCDVIAQLLKSKPKRSSPDLSIVWLQCIKQLATSSIFSAPGNNIVYKIQVCRAHELMHHWNESQCHKIAAQCRNKNFL